MPPKVPSHPPPHPQNDYDNNITDCTRITSRKAAGKGQTKWYYFEIPIRRVYPKRERKVRIKDMDLWGKM
jgi:hypothetical protein